jgi:hypothetical protein
MFAVEKVFQQERTRPSQEPSAEAATESSASNISFYSIDGFEVATPRHNRQDRNLSRSLATNGIQQCTG